jgi:soluble lytic murein transglycosylase-like protein
MKDEHYHPLPNLIERWKSVNSRSRELYRKYRRKLKGKIRNKSVNELASIDQRFMRRKAVMSGVKYLAQLFEERNGDVREALAAYNAGPGSVRRHGGIPPYTQTVHYQNTIVNTYQRYRQYLNPGLWETDHDPALSMVN